MSGSREAAFPEIVPIFPLIGVLLLPRGRLPLNIFEPRYLAMTRDAVKAERFIGMVQPSDSADMSRNPPVYPVGCAGRITSFAETDDGRYLITLTGIARFRIARELPLLEGYRRVVADWTPFAGDIAEAGEPPFFDRDRLMRGLGAYFKQYRLSADWEALRTAPGERLVTTLAMMCPFEPSEKQALLEAADFSERARLLTAIVEMAAQAPSREGGGAARH
jgi:Lon protease-like protein